MKTNKIIMGGLAGGVAFFLLGWLLYGMLTMNYLMEHTAHHEVYRAENDMVWWAMLLSDFALAFFFTIIYAMFAKLPTVSQGMSAGALLGVLLAISGNMISYSMMNFKGLHAIAADVVVFGVMCSAGSAVIVWVMGIGKKAEA